jgi:hypothetical protein
MTRVMAPPSSVQAAAVCYDRVFYSGITVLILLIVLAGFAPTYYVRLFTIDGPTVTISGSPLHAATSCAWPSIHRVGVAVPASGDAGGHA